MNGRMRTWVRRAALALPVLLISAEAFGRAGGGGGFHGGGGGGFGGGHGGGGGGGSGGGGGLFYLLYLLLQLDFQHPLIGLPITAAIIWFFVWAQQQGAGAYRSSVIRRGNSIIDDQTRAGLVTQLRTVDPAFDEDAFYRRVSSAFIKIQDAWANQNLQAVRPFISDGVFERFNLQFDEQRTLGYRNAMANVLVNSVRIAAMQSDNLFDQLCVRIEASANDYNVSLTTGSRIAGSDDSGEFVEVWSFLRRRGVQTQLGKDGLIEGNCPNCGAAIEMNQNANCAHCGAMLRSGQYDWVLAEITQESEWVPSERTDFVGVRALIARDADFNLQDLEDRASVMFWRRAASERIGDIRPLRKIALAEFCEAAAQDFQQRGSGQRDYYGECAVGSVDTLGIVSDADWDRALVEVRWAGTLFVIASKDAKPEKTARTTLTRTVLELSRRAGVKSDAGKAISSSHCPNCGAPESGKDDKMTGACEFCGAVLNDGTRTWVLSTIRAPDVAQAMLSASRDVGESNPMPAVQSQSPVSAVVLLAWMIKMALADGTIEPAEMEMLTTLRGGEMCRNRSSTT